MRQDVLKADLLLKEGADVDITLCAAAFRGSLLTKVGQVAAGGRGRRRQGAALLSLAVLRQVPAMTRNMPMLCCLVEHGAELDWYSLNYVLEHSHLLPAPHAPLEHFLTKYVRATRNPANTCYAIAHCLSNAAKDIASKVSRPPRTRRAIRFPRTARRLSARLSRHPQASEFNVLSEKFRMAAISLIEDLNKLSYLGGTERWMLRPDEVLEPTKHYSEHFPINLASCSSTALKMHDTEYSSTSTVQNLIQRAWVGVGFIQVRRLERQRTGAC